jgi:hypothetical protein
VHFHFSSKDLIPTNRNNTSTRHKRQLSPITYNYPSPEEPEANEKNKFTPLFSRPQGKCKYIIHTYYHRYIHQTHWDKNGKVLGILYHNYTTKTFPRQPAIDSSKGYPTKTKAFMENKAKLSARYRFPAPTSRLPTDHECNVFGSIHIVYQEIHFLEPSGSGYPHQTFCCPTAETRMDPSKQ